MKILIAEDDGASRRLLEATLAGWGYDVEVTCDGFAAREALLAAGGPRLAILDWMMPGVDGVAVCREVRAAGLEAYRYVVLLTSQSGDDDLAIGLDAGADDFIAKPFRPPELRARLRSGRRILALHDELLAERNLFKRQAQRDQLTGLWNHGEILRILGLELVRAGREHRPLGVIIGDVDRFKAINDTFGHLAGDAVVRAIADTMTALLRPYDGIGRYGGDEFLIVLPACDAAQTLALAERLREGIASGPVVTSAGLAPVTMSLGVAACPDHGATPERLVTAADAALYRAKRHAANRVCLAELPTADHGAAAAPEPAGTEPDRT